MTHLFFIPSFAMRHCWRRSSGIPLIWIKLSEGYDTTAGSQRALRG